LDEGSPSPSRCSGHEDSPHVDSDYYRGTAPSEPD
jgi:hypothetical protein